MDADFAVPRQPTPPHQQAALQLLPLPLLLTLPLRAPGRRPGNNPRTQRIMAA